MRKLIAGKLHGIRVTDANLNYHDSIVLDPEHCEEAGILPLEFVDIWNQRSGAHISTYVILGERGSKCCIVNGAAARTCQSGDELVVYNSVYLDDLQLLSAKPTILTFDAANNVIERLRYSASVNKESRYTFEVLNEVRECRRSSRSSRLGWLALRPPM
jgi:aspartate 1-decarboxylase